MARFWWSEPLKESLWKQKIKEKVLMTLYREINLYSSIFLLSGVVRVN